MRVLLVASGSRSITTVAAALRGWGHQVDQIRSDPEPASLAPCDVLLVDLDRPDGAGPRLCRHLRARTGVAVIGLAVRGRERHGVAALREGADDYLVWPTEVPELIARIDAVLRRSRPPPGGEQAVGRGGSTSTGTRSLWTERRSRSPRKSSGCSPHWPGHPARWSPGTG